MNLLSIHKLVITMAVVFCAGFAVRGVIVGVRGPDAVALVLAAVAAVGGIVLAVYLRWLVRVKGRAMEDASRRAAGEGDR